MHKYNGRDDPSPEVIIVFVVLCTLVVLVWMLTDKRRQ
jgi:hypothetical protein